jgi:predicted DNA-binding ribbon-helix-helix protein
MTAMTLKMVPTAGGKRAAIRLDNSTWQAVEWLANRDGATWQQWCAKVIAANPDSDNVTAAVRSAAMDGLLNATIFDDRAEQLAAMAEHPLLKDSAAISDAQLDAILSTANIQGSSDFSGFAVIFGQDEYGQDCVWIKNGLRNHLHFSFVVPNAAG